MSTQRPGGTVWRLRFVTCCVLLTALSFAQRPGWIAADTKVDLAVSPAAWLARALHAWDPAGNFGQMQNQAYGYLWPMGPFFTLGRLLTVPAWVIQRLWWALLLCLAFAGVVRLAGRLGIGTPATRLAGGLVFALSPRILSELGPVSVEAWPSAVAPWVLLPLVGLAHGDIRPRRAVALSGLAVATAGGVNATAVLAVLPLPLLWLLTVRPLRRRVIVTAAWGAAVGGATAWWVLPLLLLGRYSPPFLDYIETADTTTRPTDLVTTVRGASHWLAHLHGTYGPGWPAGFRLATEVPLVVATMVVAGLSLAGLARHGLPHRRFLVTGVLAGAALVGLGHLSVVDGAFAPAVHAWLDAAGAPLRNVHKFDVLLRLPLALGLIHLLGTLSRAASTAGPRRWPTRLRAATVGITAATALAVVAGPALAGGLPGRGSFLEVPGYWRSATAWLDAHAGTSRVLVVPGARFPSYLWGAPGDEMVQPLLRSAWAVRNSVPLAPPTTVRLLDAVETVLAGGEGSPGLAALLSRSGVRYLLVRADLDNGRSSATRNLAARAALARSPGIAPVVAFGPVVGGQPSGFFVDRGLDIPGPALQVYEVRPAAAAVAAYGLEDVRTVVGGPESLADLAAAGQLGPAPAVLAGDLPASGLSTGGLLLTDGLRRREVTFGQARDNASATLSAGQPWRLDQPAHDYDPAWAARWQTVARYYGIADVTASSSYAQALPLAGNRPEHQPFAALDGDQSTSWRSAPGTAAPGQWLEVTFDRPRPVREVTVTVDRGADTIPIRIEVRAGNEHRSVEVTGDSVTVPLTDWLAVGSVRVTIEMVWNLRLGYGGVGIAELTVPGLRAQRTLVLPGPEDEAAGDVRRDIPVAAATPSAAPSVVLGAAPSVPACLFLDRRPYCSAETARASEDGAVLDRTVPWASVAGDHTAQLWAQPRAGPELSAVIDRALAGLDTPGVTASSVGVAEPAARPGAVTDGDPYSVWHAGEEDRTPWLRLSWLSARPVTGLRITLPDGVAASRPWAVTVLTDGGARTGTLDGGGMLRLDPPVLTDDLTVLFTGGISAESFAPYVGRFERLPIGVGEVAVLPPRSPSPGDRDTVVRMPCGSGPMLEVAGRRTPTAFTTTVADLLERREIAMRLCTTDTRVRLGTADGPARVVATGSRYAAATRLALLPGSRAGAAATAVNSVLSVDRWQPARRRVTLAEWATERLLVLRENTNAGWRARIGGQALRPVVVDGWQQGWIVPAGLSGQVSMVFAPDRAYRIGLAGGAVLATAVVALAALPTRPVWAAAAAPVRYRRRARWSRRLPPPLVGAAALVLVGGYAAVVLAVVGAWSMLALAVAAREASGERRRQLRRAARRAQRWAPVALFAAACLLSLGATDPHSAAAPQLAVLAALVALWLTAAGRRSR